LDGNKPTYKKSKKIHKKIHKKRYYYLYIKISIFKQTMKVYRENRLVYKWAISTGKEGYETPLGNFKPIFIRENYRSRVCNRLFLKNVIFLKNDLAIFGVNTDKRLKRGDAYRCIKLGNRNSKTLYSLVKRYGKRRVKIKITR
jgi:lipoprotein-anchoring transpeptidase ErfK/SrfK